MVTGEGDKEKKRMFDPVHKDVQKLYKIKSVWYYNNMSVLLSSSG